MDIIEKFDLKSLDIKQNQIQKLKQLFPEAFTEGDKIDWNRLRLTLGENVDTGKERYGMNWPGKADCFRTIQQPSIATLVPNRDESVNFDTTENLFIEGDNLEALKLLQKSYLGKIKMIYIDPPYNTGNDFIYPDNYTESLQTYLEYTGQVDGEGRKFGTNTDTDGRFHSKWLNMMYPRLFLAKNLLREDGAVFISIDDNEVNNLKSLCNEIFGEENFLGCISVISNLKGRSDDKYFASSHNYLLVYSKGNFITKGIPLPDSYWEDYPETYPNGKHYRLLGLRKRGSHSSRKDRPKMFYPIYVSPNTFKVSLMKNPEYCEEVIPKLSDGSDGCWRWGKETVNDNIDFLIAKKVRPENRWDIFQIDFAENEEGVKRIKPKTFWLGSEFSNEAGTLEVKKIIGKKIFDTPKPIGLLNCIIEQSLNLEDIVLDFFAGSCTTAHAVMDLNKEDGGNRKFICVQLPEQTDEKSEAYKAGYKTIADIGKERIRRAGKKIINDELLIINKKKEELGKLKDKLHQLQNESVLIKNTEAIDSLQQNINNQQTAINNSQLIINNFDIGFKVFKLQQSNFKVWQEDIEKTPEAIQTALELNIEHITPEAKQEAILYELLLKSGFELTTPIKQVTLEGKTVFSIAEGQLLVCLEKDLTYGLIKAMAEMQPVRVICLDDGFHNNDQLKTNAVQIMKSKGVVNFRTV